MDFKEIVEDQAIDKPFQSLRSFPLLLSDVGLKCMKSLILRLLQVRFCFIQGSFLKILFWIFSAFSEGLNCQLVCSLF